jgi:hypothetical protein
MSHRNKRHFCPECETRLDTCSTCGKVVDQIPRSLPQMRRFQKMITSYFDHWPNNHPRQFSNRERFRKWAEMKVGHYDAVVVPLAIAGGAANPTNVEGLKAAAKSAIAAAGAYAEIGIKGELMTIYRPKSIAFDALPHSEATRIMSDVEVFLEGETGMNADTVMRETEDAA